MPESEQKSLANLRIIRSLVKESGNAKKYLGQNFLVNQKSLFRFVDSLNINKEDIVIEIGPGLGVLSYTLCERAKKVYMIEIDSSRKETLERVLEGFNNYEIIFADATNFDYTYFLEFESLKVIGSLPYNVCKLIIRNIFESDLNWTQSAFILQKEVVESYSSVEPKKDFLGAYAEIFCDKRENLFKIKPDNFYPIPKVDSSVIRFQKRLNKVNKEFNCSLAKFIKTGYSSPRKKVSNNLKGLLKNIDVKYSKSRPAELSYNDWCELFKSSINYPLGK